MNRRRWGILIFVVAILALATIVFVATASEKEGKAFLGIVPGEVTSDLATEYGVAGGAGNGIMVEGVSSDTPAEKAGLRENDVILKVNGASITGPQEFRHQLSKLKPGDLVDIVYLRAGKEKTVNVKLGHREDDQTINIFSGPNGNNEFHLEGAPWEWGISKKGDKSAFAGIITQGLSDGLAEHFKVESGALISEVVKKSPAEKAGLKAGDVIKKIGDEQIEDEDDVRSAIRDHKPGDNTDFVIVRDGVETTIKVTLGTQASSHSRKGEKSAFAGIVTQGLSDGLARHFNVENGALISEVVKDSPAEKAGLKAGDVITKIGDEKIEDEGDVRSAIRDHKPGDNTNFVVVRDGKETTIKVILGEQADSDSHFFHFGNAEDGSMGYLDIPDQKDLKELQQSLKGLAVELRDMDTGDLQELKESLKSMAIELKDVPDTTIEKLKHLNIPNLKIKVKKDGATPEPKKSSSHLRMQVMGTYV